MIRNYTKIAIRSLGKNFIYSLINITGLSVGLASFFLIVIWINNELSYDRYHEHADRMYRASLEFASQGTVYKTAVSPTAMLPTLLMMPEVEKGVRVYHQNYNPPTVRIGTEKFREENFFYADSTFFEIFTVRILKGSPRVLNDPSQVALSEKVAIKYFGNEEALGKTLQIGSHSFVVNAIYENMPPNSHFQAGLLVPFSSLPQSKVIQWGSANYYTYFLINPGASPESLNKKVNKKLKEDMGGSMTVNMSMKINFIKVPDIHLYSQAASEVKPKGSVTYIYIFTSIALLIIVIACINYMNLASARATERAREVGVRKVLGAYRKQLFTQFIGESFILSLTAGLLSLILVQLAMPLFSELAGFSYNITVLLEARFIYGFILLIIIVTLTAGSYPALALSSFRPRSVLSGNYIQGEKGAFLRKILVIFQFVITMILISGTFIIHEQLSYVQNKSLGYEKDRIIELNYKGEMADEYEALRNRMIADNSVVNVARGSDSPVGTRGGYSIKVPTLGDDYSLMITGLAVDEHYISSLGMKIKKGRGFRKNDWKLLQDTIYSFIINETTQKALLLDDQETIGTRISMNGRKGEIVGVVEDFHFSGLQNEIGPLVMFLEHQYNNIFIKLNKKEQIRENIASLETLWKENLPGVPFEFSFLDQEYNSLYVNEIRIGKLFFVFAVLAIFIACLGLLGLMSFLAVRKSREIGIRKVLGASVYQLVLLLSKDFARLIFLAILLSIPVGWYFMDIWLNNFAYKISMDAMPFIMAGALATFIGLVTISFQSLRAANANPVNSLQSE